MGVLDEVQGEMSRQLELFGEQNWPDGTGAPLYRFDLAYYRRENQKAVESGKLNWRLIAGEEFYESLCEKDPVKLRAELVQLAAVCTSWIESIDRRGAK